MDTPLAPCFVTRRRLPVSCACLVQCEAAGHAARIDCIHDAPTLDVPSYRIRVDLRNTTPPWLGSPVDLKRQWPELHIQYDPSLAARLFAAVNATRAAGLCGGHGISLAVAADDMELRRALGVRSPPLSRESAECVCAPHRSGPACAPISWPASNCINSCSGAGTCYAGTCICDAFASGIDCSDAAAGAASARPPASAAANGTAAAGSATEPARGRGVFEARIGVLRPRIYVYELPPHLSTWLALPHVGDAINCGTLGGRPCWWQLTDPMYSADLRLLNRLLTSPHRTLQPEHADYFYVPLMLSLGFVTHRFGIYLPSAPAARMIDEAVRYVRTAYPYWNRTRGADHMLAITGDDGSAWLRGRLPHLEHAIFLTHWGLQCNDDRLRPAPHRCVGGQIGFRAHKAGQDVVLPPLHSPHRLLPMAAWLQPAAATTWTEGGSTHPPAAAAAPAAGGAHAEAIRTALRVERKYDYLLYFVGKVSRSKREGDIYSGGVRQRVYAHYANRSDFYLRERPGAQGGAADLDALRRSKFCLAPHGTGFGMRQFDAVVHGCVPLIVRVRYDDDEANGGTLEQPYAEMIPWNAIALHVTRADIPRLPEILRAVPAARHAAMRQAAACAWPRLFWMPVPTGRGRVDADHAPEPKRDVCGAACQNEISALAPHDAFGTLMWILAQRMRARRAKAAASSSGEDPALAWSRVEGQWDRGPKELRSAPWTTPATSCAAAMALNSGLL